MFAFVDIQHFAAIFRFTDIQHLAGTDGTSAEWIILVTNGFHLNHVRPADRFVSTFIEQDTGIVAIINDSVTHQLHPLFPLASFTVFFRITGRHCLYQTYTVARFYILFPRSDVHPANQVGITLHHQVV